MTTLSGRGRRAGDDTRRADAPRAPGSSSSREAAYRDASPTRPSSNAETAPTRPSSSRAAAYRDASPRLDTAPPTPPRPPSGARIGIAAAVLAALLAVSVVVAVTLGPASLTPDEVWRSILAHLGVGESALSPVRDAIVWELRMPRILTAAAVGAGLALCGAIMQALTRNPLADPYLLGLSSGASVGAVIVIILGAAVALPLAAFAGALLALVATLGLASAFGAITPSRTILAGLAVSSVFGALTSLVIFWSATGDSYREILGWLLGSLAGAHWDAVWIAGGALLVVGVPLLFSAGTLDAFAFGDRSATALGVPVTRVRWILLGATALLTGALVSVSGSIGFVGLILPHAVRAITGSRHRALLPLSALAGALFLVWADTLARTVFDPRELPVGIVTALIGGPVFALLMLRNRRIG